MKIKDIKNRDFYKFSKSDDAKDSKVFKLVGENRYAKYVPGEVTYPEGEKGLYFTNGYSLLQLIGYGNQLTVINFDEKNKHYKEIENLDCEYQNNNLDQYESCAVITKENLSLAEPSTIKKIILMTDKYYLDRCVNSINTYSYSKMPAVSVHLKRLGYYKSLKFWNKFIEEYTSVGNDINKVDFTKLDKFL